MPVIRIDGAMDSRVAEYRNVPDPELVRAGGLFVAEGRLVVSRLVGDPRYVVRSVLVSEAACRALEATLTALPPSVPVFVCGALELASITGIDFHRGCLALVERPATVSLSALLAGARTIVVLEGVTNPDNVGGVFRNAAAFGADGVVLSPTCCDPLYRKAIRTSMSATLRIPFTRVASWPGALEEVRSLGLTIAALTPHVSRGSVDPLDLPRCAERIALLVGTEGDGLSAAAGAAADLRVRIPIQPDIDSLNLAVATGIALFAVATGRSRDRLRGIS
jgi:tRNA G18 (ribose-2'-O)-methylase SpoU